MAQLRTRQNHFKLDTVSFERLAGNYYGAHSAGRARKVEKTIAARCVVRDVYCGAEEKALIESEFQAVFEQYKDPVYRFVWRMTNSPDVAEDITQEVFLTLLRQRARFDATRGQIRPFLLGIARNLVLKTVRRDKDRWSALDQEQFTAKPVDFAGCELADIIAKTIQDLPPLQREVLVLAHYEGLSLDEIARTVDAEVGTVKSRLHRARENLRRMLEPLKGVLESSATVWNR